MGDPPLINHKYLSQEKFQITLSQHPPPKRDAPISGCAAYLPKKIIYKMISYQNNLFKKFISEESQILQSMGDPPLINHKYLSQEKFQITLPRHPSQIRDATISGCAG